MFSSGGTFNYNIIFSHNSCYGKVTILLGVQVIEGYIQEHADCMVCDYVGGPLIIRNRQRPAHNQD
jgi:hypothetical protein